MTSLFASPVFVPFRVKISWMAFHEAGHVVTAAVLGAPVLFARIHEGGGGSTSVNGDPRDMLLVSLGGHAAERLFAARNCDVRCSSGDYQRAFAHGITLARDEERTRDGGRKKSVEAKLPQAKRAPRARALAAVSVAQIEAGADRVAARIAARWLARAEKLVALAEVEVSELLDANRRALRLIAARLEENKTLDAVDLIALAGEGRLTEYEREEEA